MRKKSRRLLNALIATFAMLLAVPALASAAAQLEASPASLLFPNTGIHDPSQTQSTQITNNGNETANLGPFSAGSPFTVDFGASECDDIVSLGIGASCNLTVRFSPEVAGPANGDVKIEYSDTGGPSLLEIPASGEGVTGTLVAGNFNFNTQPYFYGGQQQFANVANTSPYTVQIQGSTITGPDAGLFNISSPCGGFLGPGQNCGFGVQFNPSAPGTFSAQLEIENDGTVNPIVIPITVEVLSGPAVAITPPSIDFGVVKVGEAATPQQVTISNTGDFPLQVQQVLIISSTPQNFPVTNDGCTLQIVNPGEGCEITVGFSATKVGERNASVFVISNSPSPVNTVSLLGEGMEPPNGSIQLTNQATIGVPIACLTHGFTGSTTLAYKWLADGDPIDGETQSIYVPVAADVGRALTCKISAANAVGSQTVTSAPSAAVAPGSGTSTLFASFSGSSKRGFALNVVAQNGLNEVLTELPSKLRIKAGKARGSVEIQSAGTVQRSRLDGARTTGPGGAIVRLARRSIRITGLPARTTSVSILFRGGTVLGSGGQIRTTAVIGTQSPSLTTMTVAARVS